MAAEIPNIAKGRFVEWYHRINNNDPANSALIVILLKAAETNATLRDYDNIGALLGAAGNTEADFTNGVTPYARKSVTVAAPIVDDTNDRVDTGVSNQTWVDAGGTTDNTLVKAITGYDSDTTAGTDANILPAGIYDIASVSTNGSDLILAFNAAGSGRAS